MDFPSSIRPSRVFLVGFALILSACGLGSDSGEVTDAELPITVLLFDEDGPDSPQGMFAEASVVLDAVLVEVIGGNRYYGPDTEAGDAATFEEVGLVFEPIELLSGEVEDTIEVQWSAYITTPVSEGAERQMRVETGGLVVDESSIGQRFAVFVDNPSNDGLLRPLTSSGLLSLNKSGEITSGGDVLFSSSVGLTLAEALEG